MYSKYWSHNQFPTWIQLDLGRPELIEGIVLFGYTLKSTPRDFQVLASEDGQEWRLVLQEIGFIERFEPVLARFVKIIILNDNGNNNVALTGVAVLQGQSGRIAVSNWKSFSAGNSLALVFEQGWKIPEEGWLLVALGSEAPQDIVVDLTGTEGRCVSTILGSDDLSRWDIITLPETQEIEVTRK